jgi:hypothetical protein
MRACLPTVNILSQFQHVISPSSLAEVGTADHFHSCQIGGKRVTPHFTSDSTNPLPTSRPSAYQLASLFRKNALLHQAETILTLY